MAGARNQLIVVVSGRVKVVVRSADGGELTLTIVPAGAVLGELSAADGGPRSTDAETLDEVWPKQTPYGKYFWYDPDAYRTDKRPVEYWDKPATRAPQR